MARAVPRIAWPEPKGAQCSPGRQARLWEKCGTQGCHAPGGSHTGGGYDNLLPPWHVRARSQGGHVLLSM